jgi:hypothetical protein
MPHPLAQIKTAANPGLSRKDAKAQRKANQQREIEKLANRDEGD